jgi:integrase
MHTSRFAKPLARAGNEAKIGFKVHPHMLRHACGYALADKGIDTRTLQAYPGHRSINSTTRYAALAPGRFGSVREHLGESVVRVSQTRTRIPRARSAGGCAHLPLASRLSPLGSPA